MSDFIIEVAELLEDEFGFSFEDAIKIVTSYEFNAEKLLRRLGKL